MLGIDHGALSKFKILFTCFPNYPWLNLKKQSVLNRKDSVMNRIMYAPHIGEMLRTSEKQLQKYGSFR